MISVTEIKEKNVWNDFVASVAPPTFLHSWEWGEFQERMKTPIVRLGAWEGERLIAVALILKIRAKRGSFLFCPHGPLFVHALSPKLPEALLGVGSVFGPPDDQEFDSSIIQAFTDRLTNIAKDEKYDFIRIAPMLADSPEHRNLYDRIGFRPAPIHMHPELAWILDLDLPEDQILKNMRKTSRYSIRKAEGDGVTVSAGSSERDLEQFWSVYGTTVKRQHFTPFSKEYFRTELEIFSARDSASIFIGSVNGEPVSAAFVVFDERSGYYHHGASSQAYPKIPASHLVLWAAIKEAKRRGCGAFNFWGISPDDQPKHPWAGLSLFKKGFGGRAEAYVPAQDMVVSQAYWINWTIESVRKKVRGL